jgi:hypothetical protein
MGSDQQADAADKTRDEGSRVEEFEQQHASSINMKATFGSVMMASNSVRQSGGTVPISSPEVVNRSDGHHPPIYLAEQVRHVLGNRVDD